MNKFILINQSEVIQLYGQWCAGDYTKQIAYCNYKYIQGELQYILKCQFTGSSILIWFHIKATSTGNTYLLISSLKGFFSSLVSSSSNLQHYQ